MTIIDPRLTQIAINIVEQHQWLGNVVWATMSDPEHDPADIQLLNVAQQLMEEVRRLIKVVDSSD